MKSDDKTLVSLKTIFSSDISIGLNEARRLSYICFICFMLRTYTISVIISTRIS